MAHTMQTDLTDMHQVYNVSFPVGVKMPNVRDDVMLVQTLMKLANFTRSTPAMGPVERSAWITVDGYFGPQTQRMIKAFEDEQRMNRRLFIADGIVEPAPRDGFTRSGVLYKIIHLNRSALNAGGWAHPFLPFDESTHPLLRQSLLKGAVKPPHRRAI
jgi:peptidoglycan hydrolase-like protein with peptidoglycan-binding domain